MLGLQILIDGFAISSLYALGAIGFTLIFGVSGVLNLSHGAIMVVAAVIAWDVAGDLGVGTYVGAVAGIAASLALAFVTYRLIVRPIQTLAPPYRARRRKSSCSPATLLWGIMLQEAIAYLFTNNPKTVRPLIDGVVNIFGVRTPQNEILTAAAVLGRRSGCCGCWSTARASGKDCAAASINPRALPLLGFDLAEIYLLVWAIYGVLAGIAGVLLGAFLGVSSDNVGALTASAFSIVVLGGLGSVSGSHDRRLRRRLPGDR